MLTKSTSQAKTNHNRYLFRVTVYSRIWRGNDDVRSKEGSFTGHNEFGMGIIVSDEKLSAVSRGLGAKHLGLRDLVHEFHASRQLDGSGKPRNEPALSRKYNYVGSGPGHHGTDSGVGSWTRPCSGTAPRPWTIRWCCQARSMSSSTGGQVVNHEAG